MNFAKIIIICIAFYYYGCLEYTMAQEIKITDFVVEGPDQSNIVHLFDEVTLKFLLKNCSDHPIDEIQISAKPGEGNDITQHPARLIRNLDPGETHIVIVELISGVRAENLEVLLELKLEENKYYALKRVFFNQIYRPELDYSKIDCENPQIHLYAIEDLKMADIEFWLDDPLDRKDIQTVSVQDSKDRNRRTGYFLGAAGVVAAGAGAYFHFKADDLYNNDYQKATYDATQIRNDILKYEKRSQYLLGAAIPLVAISTYSIIKQNRMNRKLNVQLYPTINRGALISLNYSF